ncbi:uncharacterized protein LOC144364555 [Saccoglossus kowalevskii]
MARYKLHSLFAVFAMVMTMTMSYSVVSGSESSPCTVATKITMFGDTGDDQCPGIKDAYITMEDTSTVEGSSQRFVSVADVAQLTNQMEVMQNMIVAMGMEISEMRQECAGDHNPDTAREEPDIVTSPYKPTGSPSTQTEDGNDGPVIKLMKSINQSETLTVKKDGEKSIGKKAGRRRPSHCACEINNASVIAQNYIHKITKHTVAFYKFDNNANDAAGNGHYGNLVGDVEFERKSGIDGGAAKFSGNGKINVDSFRLYPWENPFSVSVWVKRAAGWSTGSTIISNGASNYGSWSVDMGTSMAGQALGASISECGDVDRSTGKHPKWTYENILAEHNSWHHVVFSFNGAKLDFYLDGLKRQKTDGTPCEYMLLRDTPLTIGGGGVGSTGSYFNGLVDELLILNTSLTYEEVQYLYTLHDPRECESPYIVAHFTFDDDFNDQSCHQRHASYESGAGVEPSNAVSGSAMMFNGVNKIEVALLKNYPYGNQFSVSLRYKRTGNFKKEQSIVWHHSWEIRAGPSSRIGGAIKTVARNTKSSEVVIGQFSTYPYENIQATDNVWHHVVMTYDGSLFKFYLDGAQQAGGESCCVGDVTTTDQSLIIGGKLPIATNPSRHSYSYRELVTHESVDFYGFIDDFRLYRQVLYQEDVSRLFTELDH